MPRLYTELMHTPIRPYVSLHSSNSGSGELAASIHIVSGAPARIGPATMQIAAELEFQRARACAHSSASSLLLLVCASRASDGKYSREISAADLDWPPHFRRPGSLGGHFRRLALSLRPLQTASTVALFLNEDLDDTLRYLD